MRRLLLACFIALACLGAHAQSPSTAVPNLAGKVELVEGEVTVSDKAKKPRRVVVGDSIFEGEGIATGKDGELHLNMEDGGFIAVRPNTRMSIATYRAEGDNEDKGIFSLLQGTFRSVTGWIGKYNPRSYQVRTPTATIGVRGTDHEPLVIPQGSSEGEPGSYDKVNVGGSYIQTRHGSIDVKPNQAGFAPWKGRPVPRLLPQVPAFFKATRYEQVIAARHDVVHKAIDQRRIERQKVSMDKKVQLEKQKIERQKALHERRKDQNAQRREQGEERRKQWQENQQKRQQERGLQREEREGRGSNREKQTRSSERKQGHGARGGGSGRD